MGERVELAVQEVPMLLSCASSTKLDVFIEDQCEYSIFLVRARHFGLLFLERRALLR